MCTPSPIDLPDRPEEMPAQGTWVRTGGGAIGRFVGCTEQSTWIWYTRTESVFGVSFETMCSKFDRFKATRATAPAKPETRRVRIGDDWVIGDILERREDGTREQFTIRATFVEGPVDLMDELGEQVEDEAFDDGGESALCGLNTDHEGKQQFVQITSVVNRVMLGRRLRGQRPHRKSVWAEVKRKLEL